MVANSDVLGLKQILNSKTEQDHDIDALIVKNTPDNSKRVGQGFQIKRFNTFQPDLTTDGIVRFIQELRYAKTETALVILLETGEPTAFTRVRNALDFSKFPFSALYFVSVHGDTLKLIEVWPNLGKEELEWSSV